MPVKMTTEEMRDIGDQVLEDAVSGLKLSGVKKYKWEQDISHSNKTVTIKIQVTEYEKVK